jgi:hypothetical protein
MAVESKPLPPPPKQTAKSSDTGDMGQGVSAEGVPYAPSNVGRKDRKVRERSREDEAHDKAVEDARKVVAEAERQTV